MFASLHVTPDAGFHVMLALFSCVRKFADTTTIPQQYQSPCCCPSLTLFAPPLNNMLVLSRSASLYQVYGTVRCMSSRVLQHTTSFTHFYMYNHFPYIQPFPAPDGAGCQSIRLLSLAPPPGLLEPVEVLPHLVVQLLGHDLGGLAVLVVLLPVKEPVGHLVLPGILHDLHQRLDLLHAALARPA